MIFSERYNFCFFELPRTGTTSVSNALITAGIGERYPGDRHVSISEYLREHKKFPEGCKIVSCVRNPMDRVLSLYVKMSHDHNSYYSQLRNRGTKTLAQRRLIRHYELINRNGWGFEEYVLNMYKWPYTDWMYRDAKHCDFILRFENLKEDYHDFMRSVGVSVVPALPSLNKTGQKENLWESCSAAGLKHAAWVFGPYLERFGYEGPKGTDLHISRLQRTCFGIADYLYTILKEVSSRRNRANV